MGTEVHCKNHVPGYYSMRDINEDSNSSSWSLFFGDKTLLNGEYYNGFMPRTVTDVYPGYEKDALKQKMLEHEATFKNQVHGFVQDNRTWEKVAMLFGKWDEAMYYVLGNPTTKLKGYDPMTEDVLLWERGKSITKTRYNLTPFAISLNELTPGLLEKLPPTDSRLRPDQRHLENGEYELANAEKLRLEQLQRQARKLQERLATKMVPKG